MRAHFDVEGATPSPFPGGAALAHEGRGWILVETDPARALGKAMAWTRQHGVADLHLIVEEDAGILARRSALFIDAPTVWWLQGTDLHATEAEPWLPRRPPQDVPELDTLLRQAGLQVIVEREHIAGELRGLEVARISEGRIHVGVGEADRELTAMLHGNLAPEDALRRVVSIVEQHRQPGTPRHPLNQLVPERWLRWTVTNDPARIGVAALEPVPAPMARRGMRERDIACAVGDGVVAVFSVGVDLDLVPAAAEARLALAPDARLLLVVPERDDHPVTHALAARLRAPADIVTVAGDWRT